jgi:predicted PurR-regulated permease PerM
MAAETPVSVGIGGNTSRDHRTESTHSAQGTQDANGAARPAERIPLAAQVALDLRWTRRRDAVITILGWMSVAAALYWVAAHVYHALLMLVIAALIAFALYPLVGLLSTYIPRTLAVFVVYLLLLSGLMALGYLVVTTAVQEMSGLARQVNQWLPAAEAWLRGLGLSQDTIDAAQKGVVSTAPNSVGSAVPLVGGAFTLVLDTFLTVVLSIYLLLDGERVMAWARRHVPVTHRGRAEHALATLERVFGGYVRSQLLISTLAAVLYGGGMFVLGVPYASLLGVLAFVLQFIPFIGPLISIAACVLVALTHGWGLALVALIYVLVVRSLMDDVLGPRISGHGVGLHPAVAILAVVAGSEVYHFWGALFAAPVAGLAQAFIRYFWIAWLDRHKELFPEEAAAIALATDAQGALQAEAHTGGAAEIQVAADLLGPQLAAVELIETPPPSVVPIAATPIEPTDSTPARDGTQ